MLKQTIMDRMLMKSIGSKGRAPSSLLNSMRQPNPFSPLTYSLKTAEVFFISRCVPDLLVEQARSLLRLRFHLAMCPGKCQLSTLLLLSLVN